VRILSVAWECPHEPYGGLGVFLSRLLPEMSRGHEVVHYCLHGFNAPVRPLSYCGARVVRVREPLIDSGGGVLVLSAVALAGEVLNAIPLFDAIIAHDAHTSLVVACGRELGVKTVYYVHLWTYSTLDFTAVVSADKVMGNSKLTAKQIKESTGRDIRVVYPASPYPPVDKPNEGAGSVAGEYVVVIPSRWQENKSPARVLKALEEVRKRVKLKIIVFGRGAELYSLPSWVVNAGTISEDEKLRLYRQADIVLQVGFPEPFGLVALEAISQGTPVLVSNQSGVGEVLPGEAIYTLDDLAEKLVQYLSSRELREELWHRERESWIMKRTWRDVWREIEEEIMK
jgi:glycosyltransferase involved in cell wall biosynthesis